MRCLLIVSRCVLAALFDEPFLRACRWIWGRFLSFFFSTQQYPNADAYRIEDLGNGQGEQTPSSSASSSPHGRAALRASGGGGRSSPSKQRPGAGPTTAADAQPTPAGPAETAASLPSGTAPALAEAPAATPAPAPKLLTPESAAEEVPLAALTPVTPMLGVATEELGVAVEPEDGAWGLCYILSCWLSCLLSGFRSDFGCAPREGYPAHGCRSGA